MQIPLLLDEHYAPEPDLMLLKRREDSYTAALPTGADVLLLIEVGDSTIGTDRRDKLQAYAQAGIPETWLADVNSQVVQVHTEPAEGAYTHVQAVGVRIPSTPTAFPDVTIAVRDVIPW